MKMTTTVTCPVCERPDAVKVEVRHTFTEIVDHCCDLVTNEQVDKVCEKAEQAYWDAGYRRPRFA